VNACVCSCDGRTHGRLMDGLGSGVEDRVPVSEAMDKLSCRRTSGLTVEGLNGGVGSTEGILSNPSRDTVRSESLGGSPGTGCLRDCREARSSTCGEIGRGLGLPEN